jgi:hypothetical protein
MRSIVSKGVEVTICDLKLLNSNPFFISIKGSLLFSNTRNFFGKYMNSLIEFLL